MNIFVKLLHYLVKLHKIYFRSFCAKFAWSMSKLIKSSIKMVNDLNLGVDKSGSMAGLDF